MAEQRKKRGGKRSSRSAVPPKRPVSIQEETWRILKAIRNLASRLHDEEGSGAFWQDAERTGLLKLEIPLENRLSKGRYDESVAQALSRIRQLGKTRTTEPVGPIAKGHIHCFLCQSSSCEHSRPEGTDSVFAGFHSTGRPVWESFTNHLLRTGDPRVGSLYGTHRAVVARTVDASDVQATLTLDYGVGPRALRQRGQVLVGHLFMDLSDTVPRVLGVQILETIRQNQEQVLVFNLTGSSFSELAEAGTGRKTPLDSLYLKLRELREKVQAIDRRWTDAQRQGRTFDVQREIDSLLRQFRGDLERIFRTASRRTVHGQERHTEGTRPTAHARRDLEECGVENAFRDTTKGTVIIVGSKGRTHVFSPGGKHVTSIQLGRQAVERRLLDGRWETMNQEAFSRWKNGVTLSPHEED